MAWCKECRGCESRFIGCHGRNADGSWRCEAWGKAQEKELARMADTQAALDIGEYKFDVAKDICKRKRSHHR